MEEEFILPGLNTGSGLGCRTFAIITNGFNLEISTDTIFISMPIFMEGGHYATSRKVAGSSPG
jgi:hypothetical protein